MEDKDLLFNVKGICIKVHRHLGCGLIESAYKKVLCHALRKEGYHVDEELPIDIHYDGDIIPGAFRADLVVEKRLLIELRAVETVLPADHLQINSYLQLSGIQNGLLVNFHSKRLIDGMYTTNLEDLRLKYPATPHPEEAVISQDTQENQLLCL
ncbi:MAG: GxxExxY protein [Muribaculaceae bacterium]|nr:GxxExxY protein [Muribaculaceae bacterium]